MPTTSQSFFEGVPRDERQAILQRLERRRYPAGAVVIAEGEMLRELYITESGWAEVFVANRAGVEHLVGRVGPGETVGEMSLFTARPAVGTVRAAEDLELLVLSEAELDRLGRTFPHVYRNLGAILSERLAITNRLAVGEEPGKLTVLEDVGAPPALACALACSVAWHTRQSTLLLVLDSEPPDELKALATDAPSGALPEPDRDRDGKAQVVVAPPSGRYAQSALSETTEELLGRHDHVLVSMRGPAFGSLKAFRTIRMAAASEPDTREPLPNYSIYVGEAAGRTGPDTRGRIAVPPLQPADELAMRQGGLPPATPAGSALGWVARDLSHLKVGVALGAGSIRGFAHWGVLRALGEMGVPVDYIAGSSVGGSVAAMYASGLRGDEAIEASLGIASTLFRPTVPTKSLLSGRALAKFLHGLHGDSRLEDLDPPTAVVTTDIRTQRSVVLRRGRVDKAVLATLAIPGIYPPQRSGSYILVDGGVLDPVPIGTVADMGASVVVGVQLLGQPGPIDADARIEEDFSARQPSALATIMRSIEIMQTRVPPNLVDATSILITPTLENIPSMKLRNLSAGVRYVEPGAAEALAARPRIAAALPWLRAYREA
jgi:NTE family protein